MAIQAIEVDVCNNGAGSYDTRVFAWDENGEVTAYTTLGEFEPVVTACALVEVRLNRLLDLIQQAGGTVPTGRKIKVPAGYTNMLDAA